ncbi:MAG: hypothetical protein VW405_01570, partial [Rhodospirillaceae bacterium]
VSIERAAQAFALRRTGMGYQRIAEAMCVSVSTAKACVDEWLAFMAAELAEDHSAVLSLEVERLDGLTEAFYPRALDGDPKAAEIVLKVMERRARYLGLDARIDEANSDKTGAEWVELLGRVRAAKTGSA